MEPLRVGILEDDEVLRRGIVAILGEQGCSCIVLDRAREVSPGLADANGSLDVAVVCSKSAGDLDLSCPVILLTAPLLSGQGRAHVKSKVMATLPHDGLTGDRLVASVRAAAAGLRVEDASSSSAPEPVLDLRRIEVLRLLATGATTRAIARELRLSERTVKTLVHDIQLSMGTTTRAQAAAEAVRLGLI
ncbi:MAG TPA: LuxR C-terminal-related transcriptional regulator [Actinomycetota bacterium]|nr:LuxR C-terminal-related transcriptional regulator [Actinomycetota bacterium]